MKRFLILLAVAVGAVSCLQSSSFSTTMTSLVTFDYDDGVFSDSLFFDTKYSKIGFRWDLLDFYHKVDESSLEFKGGFLVSSLNTPISGNTSGLQNNRYRSNVKSSDIPRNKYAVLSVTGDMPDDQIAFKADGTGLTGTCQMLTVWVSNTVEVAEAVRNTFLPGDQLVLRATGYLDNQVTDKAEIKLADFTAEKDSIVNTWTAFDLSDLGTVDKVRFEIQVPAERSVPMAVCMDNLMASLALSAE